MSILSMADVPHGMRTCRRPLDPLVRHIAQAAVQIVAIRTSPESGRIPDYKNDVPRECYEGLDTVLEQLFEDLEYLTSEFGDLLTPPNLKMSSFPQARTGSLLYLDQEGSRGLFISPTMGSVKPQR